MTADQMEIHIAEASSSLSVEGLHMTDREKENLRRVGRGEITFSELISHYIEEARSMGGKHA